LNARNSVSSAYIVDLFQILVSQGPKQIVMESYFGHSLVKDSNVPAFATAREGSRATAVSRLTRDGPAV
jgi:hypothetical protein